MQSDLVAVEVAGRTLHIARWRHEAALEAEVVDITFPDGPGTAAVIRDLEGAELDEARRVALIEIAERFGQ